MPSRQRRGRVRPWVGASWHHLGEQRRWKGGRAWGGGGLPKGRTWRRWRRRRGGREGPPTPKGTRRDAVGPGVDAGGEQRKAHHPSATTVGFKPGLTKSISAKVSRDYNFRVYTRTRGIFRRVAHTHTRQMGRPQILYSQHRITKGIHEYYSYSRFRSSRNTRQHPAVRRPDHVRGLTTKYGASPAT